MNQFGYLYAQYYELLYLDKDYTGEVQYIEDLMAKFSKNPKEILDLGCGTGKHATIFCDKGYIVCGIDLSEQMLDIAAKNVIGRKKTLSFNHCAIADLNLNKRFDVVVSLFHVMSYQNSNDDLMRSFEVVSKHLKDGGLFIFDFWYGPAVLNDLPVTRVKRLENEIIKVTRIAEPKINENENIVNVNYNLFLEDKKTKKIIEGKETHNMRFLFDKELESICDNSHFGIVKKLRWMTQDEPSKGSWGAAWVVRKKP